MGYFKVFKGKDDQFYFNLKADNHQIILQSEGYTTKQNAQNGIESVKVNAAFDSRFDRLTAKNNQFYFVLKAANGQVIGVSETYTSTSAMENGVESVRKNAPTAEIKED